MGGCCSSILAEASLRACAAHSGIGARPSQRLGSNVNKSPLLPPTRTLHRPAGAAEGSASATFLAMAGTAAGVGGSEDFNASKPASRLASHSEESRSAGRRGEHGREGEGEERSLAAGIAATTAGAHLVEIPRTRTPPHPTAAQQSKNNPPARHLA